MLFGQAAGGVLGDYFGWRNVFFILASLFAIATAALVVEMLRNPSIQAGSSNPHGGRSLAANYRLVLSGNWSWIVIFGVFVEGALMFGSLAYVGADLHLRFDLGLTAIGLVVGTFALGGLSYALTVSWLVARLGQVGLLKVGAVILAIGLLMLAVEPHWWLAPAALVAIGLGYYMLHNTLQVNATQMTPEARGTAVAIFSACFYLGQTTGVAAGSLVIDRFAAIPIFVTAAILFPIFGFWFAQKLAQHRRETEPSKT
jgi:predicted MFS family arabinose efflux permease